VAGAEPALGLAGVEVFGDAGGVAGEGGVIVELNEEDGEAAAVGEVDLFADLLVRMRRI
jgi:hypothetical protein